MCVAGTAPSDRPVCARSRVSGTLYFVGLFDRGGEPVFLKEPWDPARQLAELQAIRPALTRAGQEAVDEEMQALRRGAEGERRVAYELKSSHMPIRVIPDWQIEHEGLSAQIDFLVLAPKHSYVIECKNLYGNITVTPDGDFHRTAGRRTVGFYSPIEQNRRHLDLIKAKQRASRGRVGSWAVDKFFDSLWKSIVVLANDETVLKASPEVRRRVIRRDQLVSWLRKTEADSKEQPDSAKNLDRRAERFLEWDVEDRPTYLTKFDRYRMDSAMSAGTPTRGRHAATAPVPILAESPDADAETMFQRLRKWRLETSKAAGIKAYEVFLDRDLHAIIAAAPCTLDELGAITGPVKAAKYGTDVLRILATP